MDFGWKPKAEVTIISTRNTPFPVIYHDFPSSVDINSGGYTYTDPLTRGDAVLLNKPAR